MGRYPTSRTPPRKTITFFPDPQTGQYYYHTGTGREAVPKNDFDKHIKKVIQAKYPGREIRTVVIPLDAMVRLSKLNP